MRSIHESVIHRSQDIEVKGRVFSCVVRRAIFSKGDITNGNETFELTSYIVYLAPDLGHDKLTTTIIRIGLNAD